MTTRASITSSIQIAAGAANAISAIQIDSPIAIIDGDQIIPAGDIRHIGAIDGIIGSSGTIDIDASGEIAIGQNASIIIQSIIPPADIASIGPGAIIGAAIISIDERIIARDIPVRIGIIPTAISIAPQLSLRSGAPTASNASGRRISA